MGTMDNKEKALTELKAEMDADALLPLWGQASLVFGEGDPASEVMFIGEAPGFHEDRLGRPFVGQAGKLLDRLLETIRWPRSTVYITNILKRRPPENRDPLPEEIEAYAPYLTRQIDIINPKVIATLGRFAMDFFLPAAKISRDRGRAVVIGSRVVVPLYHPAAALRSTAVLHELEADFKKLPQILGEWAELVRQAPAGSAAAPIPKQVSLF